MGSNISALLKPVVRANGSELEIPHSMIGKSRLQVRRLSELEAMINKVEDDDVRIMLQKIYDPPSRKMWVYDRIFCAICAVCSTEENSTSI